jgi:hypothetical protein
VTVSPINPAGVDRIVRVPHLHVEAIGRRVAAAYCYTAAPFYEQ